jgi:hypothetical protein
VHSHAFNGQNHARCDELRKGWNRFAAQRASPLTLERILKRTYGKVRNGITIFVRDDPIVVRLRIYGCE